MIEDARLENVTLLRELTWDDLAPVKLVIGENDTGKSNLLRMLYTVSRSFQELTRMCDEAPVESWLSLAHER